MFIVGREVPFEVRRGVLTSLFLLCTPLANASGVLCFLRDCLRGFKVNLGELTRFLRNNIPLVFSLFGWRGVRISGSVST